jgi:predicted outer membrane repeat protein
VDDDGSPDVEAKRGALGRTSGVRPTRRHSGDGWTHPGGATSVRAERTTVWWRLTDVEALRPAPVAPAVPTIPEGEGECEAWFNQNSKPHGGGALRGGDQLRWWPEKHRG